MQLATLLELRAAQREPRTLDYCPTCYRQCARWNGPAMSSIPCVPFDEDGDE